MKTIQYHFILLIVSGTLFLASCAPMYQVMKTTASEVDLVDNNFIFLNDELELRYNMWAQGGELAFELTNKLDVPLYVDWNKSHFIYNGVSYEYWYDGEESKSFYSSTTEVSGIGNTALKLLGLPLFGSGITTRKKEAQASTTKIKPKQVIHIPPKSTIIVNKFAITNTRYFTCDFPFKRKSSRKIFEIEFNEENSPLVFNNYLTYSTPSSFSESKTVNNKFFVSTISNMNEKVFKGKSKSERYCLENGRKKSRIVYPYPYKQSNSFFLRKN